MKYCSKCGSFLPEGVNACPNCGMPVETEFAPNENANTNPNPTADGSGYYNAQPFEQSGAYNGGFQNSNPSGAAGQNYFNQPAPPNPQNNFNGFPPNNDFMPEHIKSELSNANTLGVIALVLGILVSSIIGIICGAIGLSKVNSLPDFPLGSPAAAEKAKVKRMNILGIVLPIAIRIVLIIIYFVFIVAILGTSVGSLSGLYY